MHSKWSGCLNRSAFFVIWGLILIVNAQAQLEPMGLDPALIGQWGETANGTNGATHVDWNIRTDGVYFMQGAKQDSGTVQAKNGWFEATSAITHVQWVGYYQIQGNGVMVTKTQRGTAVWHQATGTTTPSTSAPISEEDKAREAQCIQLWAKGQTDEVIILLSQAIAANPADERAWFDRAMMLLKISGANRSLGLDAQSAMGESWVSGFDATAHMAMNDFTRAISLNPYDTGAWVMRSHVFLAFNDTNNAMSDLDQAIRIDPNYAIGYMNRGEVKFRSGEDGTSDVNQGFALDPSLHKEFDSQVASYMKMNDNRILLGKALRAWNSAQTNEGDQTLLRPWLAYGKAQVVPEIDFHFGSGGPYQGLPYLKNFPAIAVDVNTLANGPPMRVWIPLTKQAANLIPQYERVPLLSPPGVAAWDPHNPNDLTKSYLMNNTGNILDSMYLKQIK